MSYMSMWDKGYGLVWWTVENPRTYVRSICPTPLPHSK